MESQDFLLLVSFLPFVFLPIFIVIIASGKQWRDREDRARARRMAEHKMNARLLRLNI
jgi:hypothetical protein